MDHEAAPHRKVETLRHRGEARVGFDVQPRTSDENSVEAQARHSSEDRGARAVLEREAHAA